MRTQAFDVEVGAAAMDVDQGACHVPYVPRPLAILADVTPILWYDLRAYVDGVRARLLSRSLFSPSWIVSHILSTHRPLHPSCCCK